MSVSKAQLSLKYFENNLNCAQSVISVFAEDLEFDEEIALKIASPFGGGMAYRGEVCGAVTGALMVIGLKFGMSNVEDSEAKEFAYERAQSFIKQFVENHNSLRCRDLIKYDLTTPDGKEQAEREDVFNRLCTQFVRSSVEIVESILSQYKNYGESI